PRALIERQRGALENHLHRAQAAVEREIELAREQLRGRELQLAALSPRRTLRRGYAICTVDGGGVLTSIDQADIGERLKVRVRDGVVIGETLMRKSISAEKSKG